MSNRVIAAKQAEQNVVPNEFRQFINGMIVDLSAASNFYKQKADVSTALEGVIVALPNSQYRLEERFRSFLVNRLSLFSDEVALKRLRAPNALAEALYQLGQQWTVIDFGHLQFPTLPTSEFLRSQWHSAGEWRTFVESGGSIGEIWHFSVREDGVLQDWSKEFDKRYSEVTLAFSRETKSPPTANIRLKGKAASMLMDWWVILNTNQANPATESRTNIETLLNSFFAVLKVNLKLSNPSAGRPRDKFSEQAAYLMLHEGLRIQQVAQELSLPIGSANDRRRSYDRIRQAIKNYYAVLRKNYKTR